MLNVKEAKTSELVAFYNAHNPSKPVKKFSDRATAEKRVAALIASLEALEDKPQGDIENAPEVVKTHKARKIVAPKGPTQAEIDAMSDEEFEAYAKSGLNSKDESPSARSNSAGIAKSWNDPEVAAKRLTRDGVKVNGGEEFKSVRAAFAAFGLPDSKHIRFRMKLKEAKKLNFEWAGKSYLFEIV